jgi:hypothetical protein
VHAIVAPAIIEDLLRPRPDALPATVPPPPPPVVHTPEPRERFVERDEERHPAMTGPKRRRR